MPRGSQRAGGRPHYALPIDMTATDPPAAGNGDEDGRPGGTTPRRRAGSSGRATPWRRRLSRRPPSRPGGARDRARHPRRPGDRLHDCRGPHEPAGRPPPPRRRARHVHGDGCLGLLGGSGSNAAGYSCRGTYTLDGQRYYRRAAPGPRLHRPGSTVAAVAVPGDPGPRLSPASMVDAPKHSSAGVFVVPPGPGRRAGDSCSACSVRAGGKGGGTSRLVRLSARARALLDAPRYPPPLRSPDRAPRRASHHVHA